MNVSSDERTNKEFWKWTVLAKQGRQIHLHADTQGFLQWGWSPQVPVLKLPAHIAHGTALLREKFKNGDLDSERTPEFQGSWLPGECSCFGNWEAWLLCAGGGTEVRLSVFSLPSAATHTVILATKRQASLASLILLSDHCGSVDFPFK